jgi:hypothetical protein
MSEVVQARASRANHHARGQMASSSSSGTWLGKTPNHLLPGSLHTKTPNTRRLENVTELVQSQWAKWKKICQIKEKTIDTKIHGHRMEVQSRIAAIGEWQWLQTANISISISESSALLSSPLLYSSAVQSPKSHAQPARGVWQVACIYRASWVWNLERGWKSKSGKEEMRGCRDFFLGFMDRWNC